MKSQRKKSRGQIVSARLSMSAICLATIAAGVLFSKLFLYFQLAYPSVRYSLAVLVSYGVFFFLIFLWLRIYFGARSKSRFSFDGGGDVLDAAVRIDAPEPRWSGGGGGFSGGGASGSWAESSAQAVEVKGAWASGSKGASRLGGAILDADDGWVLVLLLALIAAIFGSAFYLVYQAPEILLEASFEVVAVVGVVRQARRLQSEGWAFAIFKRTWIPFAVVLVIAAVFGAAIQLSCPGAISFAEYRTVCSGHSQRK